MLRRRLGDALQGLCGRLLQGFDEIEQQVLEQQAALLGVGPLQAGARWGAKRLGQPGHGQVQGTCVWPELKVTSTLSPSASGQACTLTWQAWPPQEKSRAVRGRNH